MGEQAIPRSLGKGCEPLEAWMEARSPGHIAAMREFGKQMRPQAGKAA